MGNNATRASIKPGDPNICRPVKKAVKGADFLLVEDMNHIN